MIVASQRELEANPLSRLMAGRNAGMAAGLVKTGLAGRTASLEKEEVSARSDLVGFMARPVRCVRLKKQNRFIIVCAQKATKGRNGGVVEICSRMDFT